MKSPKNSRNKKLNPDKPTNKKLRKLSDSNEKFTAQLLKHSKKTNSASEVSSYAPKSVASKVKGKPVPVKRNISRGGSGLGGAFGIKNK